MNKEKAVEKLNGWSLKEIKTLCRLFGLSEGDTKVRTPPSLNMPTSTFTHSHPYALFLSQKERERTGKEILF
jgi:hypothetical protein